jgi:hypothetical protein
MVEKDRGGALVLGVWCLEGRENQRSERVKVSRCQGPLFEDMHP